MRSLWAMIIPTGVPWNGGAGEAVSQIISNTWKLAAYHTPHDPHDYYKVNQNPHTTRAELRILFTKVWRVSQNPMHLQPTAGLIVAQILITWAHIIYLKNKWVPAYVINNGVQHSCKPYEHRFCFSTTAFRREWNDRRDNTFHDYK
jgi:hypothetical protein